MIKLFKTIFISFLCVFSGILTEYTNTNIYYSVKEVTHKEYYDRLLISSNQTISNQTFNNEMNIKINNNQTYNNFILFKQELTIDMFYTTFASITYFTIILGIYSFLYTNYSRFMLKNTRLCGYKSLGTIIFIILFTIWTILTIIYSFMTNDIGDILFRLGIWIIINIIFILLPIPRNNMFTKFFKIPHSEIVFIHSYIAILCILSVIVKFIVVLIYYPPEFLIVLLNKHTGGSPLAGTLATFGFILSGLVGLPYIRTNFYEIFYYSHRILTLMSFIATIWHYQISIFYLLPPTIVYICDLVLRCKYINNGVYLKLNNIGNEQNNTSCVVMNIKINNFKLSPPGSYYLICFRNISYLQWHPFSLVKQNNHTLTFCAKNMGKNSWTEKLKNINIVNIQPEIYIQGPYNYFDVNFIIKNYEYIICICGGIGVTPIFSILEYITEFSYLNKIPVKNILFIWILPHLSLVDYFNESINELNHDLIEIQIYVTKQKIDNTYPRYIKSDRPDIKNTIETYVKLNKINTNKLCTLSVGPKQLLNSIKSVSIDNDIDNYSEEF